MGSIGSSNNNYLSYAPAWDYSGYEDDDRNDVHTEYFKGIKGMPVNTNLTDWVDDSVRNYTENEKETLGYYTENSSMNEYLRQEPNFTSPIIKKMDAVIANHTLNKDTILYSGITDRNVAGIKNLDNLKKGDTFKISSFVSTSPDPKYAGGYALQSSNETPTVLQIQAPKGTHIAKTFYSSAFGTEGVLGRNSKFEVVGTSSGTVHGEKVKILKVKLVKK